MKLSSLAIRVAGVIESLVMSLPMPWRLRMAIASVLGRVIGWFLTHNSTIYDFVIERNREYGMGKQELGEMQSIHALKFVLKEVEQRKIDLNTVKRVARDAKSENISEVDLPRYLGNRLLGADATTQLFRHLPGY